MTIYCRSCGLSNFHASHFRFRAGDVSQLLLFRFPIRCLTCHRRAYTSLLKFLELRRARKTRQ